MFSGLTRKEQYILLALVGVIGIGLAAHQVRDARQQRVFDLVDGKKPRELTTAPTPPEDPPPNPVPAEPDKININTATATELQRLDGIGPRKAQVILEDRATRGPFQTVDDLDRVKGIGPSTLEKLRPYITTGATPTPPPPAPGTADPILAGAAPGIPLVQPGATPPPSAAGAVPPAVSLVAPGAPTASNAAPVGPIAANPAPVAPPRASADARININRATEQELQRLNGVGEVLARRIIEFRTTYGPFRRPEDLMKVKGIGPKTLEKNRDLITVE